jgi:hypothetical protein
MFSTMRCKQAGRRSGDDNDPNQRPSLPALLKGKSLATKKKKTSKRRRLSPPAQRALAVASATERIERGGRGHALVITKEGSTQAQRSEAEAMETEE